MVGISSFGVFAQFCLKFGYPILDRPSPHSESSENKLHAYPTNDIPKVKHIAEFETVGMVTDIFISS